MIFPFSFIVIQGESGLQPAGIPGQATAPQTALAGGETQLAASAAGEFLEKGARLDREGIDGDGKVLKLSSG